MEIFVRQAAGIPYPTASTRIVINGYLSGLSRPEQVVYFIRQVVGASAVTKEVISGRTGDYQGWLEAFAPQPRTPIEWTEKGVHKEAYVRRWPRSMERRGRLGCTCSSRAWSKDRRFGYGPEVSDEGPESPDPCVAAQKS